MQGFDSEDQYKYLVVQAQEGEASNGGIVEEAFRKHTREAGFYAFKEGFGTRVCDEVEGFDLSNFEWVETDYTFDFSPEYEARVEEETRFERECAEMFAGRDAGEVSAICKIGARLVAEAMEIEAVAMEEAAMEDKRAAEAIAAMAVDSRMMPAKVGDEVMVSV
jgi:hypothetical protein